MINPPYSGCPASDRSSSLTDHSELFSLPTTCLEGEDSGYLNQAATELTAAMEQEKEGKLSSAIQGYRTAVDILITGVQGENTRIQLMEGQQSGPQPMFSFNA